MLAGSKIFFCRFVFRHDFLGVSQFNDELVIFHRVLSAGSVPNYADLGVDDVGGCHGLQLGRIVEGRCHFGVNL